MYVEQPFDAMCEQDVWAESRETFAGTPVLYDKIMGCAKFIAAQAASRRETGCDAVRWSEINPHFSKPPFTSPYGT